MLLKIPEDTKAFLEVEMEKFEKLLIHKRHYMLNE